MILEEFPDEILLMIFQCLTSVDVLYLFYKLNRRLNGLVCDRTVLQRLTIEEKISHEKKNRIASKDILHRLSSEILPEIAEEICQMELLHSSSMKEIFKDIIYPNLSHLSLNYLTQETIHWLFTHEKFLHEKFHRIEILQMKIDENDVDESSSLMLEICANVFIRFPSLIHLELIESSLNVLPRLTFEENPLDQFRSSTLVKLKIHLLEFEDCLYLFDGRFPQLENVDLNIYQIDSPSSIVNQDSLPHMKHFSICSSRSTMCFEKDVLPFLTRMSNLETLRMSLTIYCFQTNPHTIDLQRNVSSLFRKLKQLTFYIHCRPMLPTEEDFIILERFQESLSLKSIPNLRLNFYLEYFPEINRLQFQLYSIPFTHEYFSGISHRFPGGTFPSVRQISLIDEKPFEEAFFRQIPQWFPRVEKISIANSKAQNCHSSNDEQSKNSPIRYSHLNQLMLVDCHDDYLEQFLLKSKCLFVELVTVHLLSESLKRVTNNLTRDQQQMNFSQINILHLYGDKENSNQIKEYLPQTKIY